MSKITMKVVIKGGNMRDGEYMVRIMDIDQIRETIRDGFVVEGQGYENRRIIGKFKDAIDLYAESIETDLGEFEEFAYNHPDWVDGSTEWEYKSLQSQKEWTSNVREYFKDRQDDEISRFPKVLDDVRKEYKALDEMSKIYVNIETTTKSGHQLWDSLESERYRVRKKLHALEAFEDWLLCGEII